MAEMIFRTTIPVVLESLLVVRGDELLEFYGKMFSSYRFFQIICIFAFGIMRIMLLDADILESV